ncbi:MAG: hypothetical protein GXO09_02705 [Crenarchaeota archaeon]|nr:hypothetical protein [Thermoproteota archaeon]
MGSYVTISVRVRRELKEEAERLGIRLSEFLRRALEEEIRRRRIEKLKAELEELRPVLEKISIEEVVEAIRRDRESR